MLCRRMVTIMARPGIGFTIVTLLPVAAFAATWIYLSRFDGWGAWGAAPLLLVPVLCSVLATSFALRRVVRERKTGRIEPATAVFAIVAAIPALWFLWRLVITW